ncbi:MAG TPA: THUMP domain-containing protein [Candidatus Methanomethylophilaceae archaeon]|nr:THUMP domain-containing protein [Candidatus Methanomethylophilaceae archaeon]
MNPIYFFELSGEAGDMPHAEAMNCAYAESGKECSVFASGPGYIIMELPPDSIPFISHRLALTRSIGRYLGSFEPGKLSEMAHSNLPDGTFAIRAKRFRGMMADVDSQKIVRDVGNIFSKNNSVDLKEPDIIIRMFMSDRVHLFIEEHKIESDLFEKRKVGERPFFSPISLHPKYARALINLTGAKRGSTVLDPFCGTGGIAIEAAEMGMKPIVSDFDPHMVAGTRENMEFYGMILHDSDVLDIGDIAEHWSDIDIVATDPPYGRSTRTGGEKIDHIYARSLESIADVLKPGGCAGIVLPYEITSDRLSIQQILLQRVHSSLTRHYHLFRK